MNAANLIKVLEPRFRATRNTIAAIPSERLDFRPMPDMLTAGELALHLIGNYTFLEAGLADGNWNADTFRVAGAFPTTGDIVSRFDALWQNAKPRLSAVPDSTFERRAAPFGPEQKVSSITHGIAEHEIQHRGQLQVYLRLMGVKPPSVSGA